MIDKEEEYFGITLSEKSDKLFLLANNTIVHKYLFIKTNFF